MYLLIYLPRARTHLLGGHRLDHSTVRLRARTPSQKCYNPRRVRGDRHRAHVLPTRGRANGLHTRNLSRITPPALSALTHRLARAWASVSCPQQPCTAKTAAAATQLVDVDRALDLPRDWPAECGYKHGSSRSGVAGSARRGSSGCHASPRALVDCAAAHAAALVVDEAHGGVPVLRSSVCGSGRPPEQRSPRGHSPHRRGRRARGWVLGLIRALCVPSCTFLQQSSAGSRQCGLPLTPSGLGYLGGDLWGVAAERRLQVRPLRDRTPPPSERSKFVTLCYIL